MNRFTLLHPSTPTLTAIFEWIDENELTDSDYHLARKQSSALDRIDLMIQRNREMGRPASQAMMRMRAQEAATPGEDFALSFRDPVHACQFKLTFADRVEIVTVAS